MPTTRRVQKIGESLFISLPKAWTRRTSLKKGESITLIENSDSSITLHMQYRKRDLKKMELKVESLESTRSLRRRLTGAYVDGFDLINIKADQKFSVEQQEEVRETTDRLFGLEIVELSSNRIIIQCLLTKTLPIESMIWRIHRTTKSMFGETVTALIERNPKLAEGIIKRTWDVRRLSLVVHRLLRTLILYPGERPQEMRAIDSVDFLRVIDKITQISGAVRKIAKSIVAWKESSSMPIREDLVKINLTVLNLYDRSMEALMSKNIQCANDVLDNKLETEFSSLLDLLLKAERESKIVASVFSYVHQIIDNLEQINLYAVEIAEIAIDRAEEISEKA